MLRLARENPGCRNIQGELLKLRLKVSRSTVVRLLWRHESLKEECDLAGAYSADDCGVVQNALTLKALRADDASDHVNSSGKT